MEITLALVLRKFNLKKVLFFDRLLHERIFIYIEIYIVRI